MMRYRIAVDTGGTFSDVVLSDDERGLSLEQLLAGTEVLIYATTRSTNAILTGGTARTALITTEGFGDTLVYREGGKLRPFDFRESYPEPYIPKRLTYEVAERVNSDVELVFPLQVADVERVLAELRDNQVEAVAVSLLW